MKKSDFQSMYFMLAGYALTKAIYNKPTCNIKLKGEIQNNPTNIKNKIRIHSVVKDS